MDFRQTARCVLTGCLSPGGRSTYRLRSWDMGFFNKRIGTMYNDNGAVNEAVKIDPFNVTNLFGASNEQE